MAHSHERRYSVHLNDARVGTLCAREDFTWFEFDDEYINDSNRAVLGLRFEENLRTRHRSNMRLPWWFSNLLPEGRLREWISLQRQVSIEREMELLAEVGHDLPGAVRVQAIDESEEIFARRKGELLGLTPEERQNSAWRFSLAGVQLKFSMLSANDKFTVPAYGDGGDWIVKLPDPQFEHVPSNEHIIMELARRAGIDVPETRLVRREVLDALPSSVWPNNEEFAFAIRRFDRTNERQRIHIEDLAQVRGFYPGDDKYRGSFETVGALIYRHRDRASVREFVRRLAFIVLVRNGDAHLKNWSLIYRNPRVPVLSPAYDLVCTSIYRPESSPEDLGLKLGRSRRFETVSLETFRMIQAKLGIQNESFAEIAADVVERAMAAWPELLSLSKNTALTAKIDSVLQTSSKMLLK